MKLEDTGVGTSVDSEGFDWTGNTLDVARQTLAVLKKGRGTGM